ncbi:MAG: hypothetical protein ACPGWS_07855 [Solirubrobacterales bacterium]
MKKYDLAKGFLPGNYTLGEGFHLAAKGNELTPAQAAPYIEAGILREQSAKATSAKKRGK